jgi:hypothetical protein
MVPVLPSSFTLPPSAATWAAAFGSISLPVAILI